MSRFFEDRLSGRNVNPGLVRALFGTFDQVCLLSWKICLRLQALIQDFSRVLTPGVALSPNLLKIGVFPLKLPGNYMILKKSGPQAPWIHSGLCHFSLFLCLFELGNGLDESWTLPAPSSVSLVAIQPLQFAIKTPSSEHTHTDLEDDLPTHAHTQTWKMTSPPGGGNTPTQPPPHTHTHTNVAVEVFWVCVEKRKTVLVGVGGVPQMTTPRVRDACVSMQRVKLYLPTEKGSTQLRRTVQWTLIVVNWTWKVWTKKDKKSTQGSGKRKTFRARIMNWHVCFFCFLTELAKRCWECFEPSGGTFMDKHGKYPTLWVPVATTVTPAHEACHNDVMEYQQHVPSWTPGWGIPSRLDRRGRNNLPFLCRRCFGLGWLPPWRLIQQRAVMKPLEHVLVWFPLQHSMCWC